MIWYVIGGLVGFGFLGLIGLIIYYQSVKKKYSKNAKLYQKDQIVVKNKSDTKDLIDRFFQTFYIIILKIPIIKMYTKKTRLKLEMVNDYTEYEVRRKTAKIMLESMLFIFAALFIFLNVVSDLYMALVITLVVFIINDVLINSKVNKVADKILRQIPEVFTEIRHSFHEHGMIEEAFNDAIDELEDKEIMPQVKRIKEAILSDNPEVALEKYYDTAPNKFLKLFAGVSYLTMELGDRKVDGVSVYLKNLNNILNDVYLEILKKDKINYMFRSLTAIAIVPILFIQPIQSWSETNFPALVNFYSSSFGFIMKAILMISIFAAYFLLKVIKEDANEIKFDRIATKKWQEKLYAYPFVRQIVNGLMPKPHTLKYKQKSEMIKTANSYLTMEWLYVNKLVTAVATFLLTFILLINMHYIDIQSVYTSLAEEYISLGQLSPEDQAASDALNKQDKELVDELEKSKTYSKQEVEAALKEKGMSAEEADIERVTGKLNKIKKAYVKYWEVIIALVLAWISYFIPNISLFIKNKIRELEKDDEVMQFRSIILMLMYIERIDVQTILEWLERYAYAFKEPIATALNNYESGAVESLEELKDTVTNKDLQRIVEALISAVERIPIRDAFDELETERAFYYERRKDTNERIIQKKSTLGKAVGFTPLVILIAGYFVGPLITVSILQLTTYFKTMNF